MGRVVLVDPSTDVAHEFDDTADGGALAEALARGWTVESDRARASRTIDARVTQDHSRPIDKVGAALAAAPRGLTIGGSDVLARAVGGEDAAYGLSRLREANPGTSLAFEAGAALVAAIPTGGASAVTPIGQVSRLGSFLSRAAPEASLATKAGRGFAGAATEGVLQEAGAVASDLALADSPDEMERIAGSIGTRFLTTGVVSGALGGGLNMMEHGLSVAKRRALAAKVDDIGAPIPDDLATLDRKGLRAAEEAELAAIEAGRVPQRQALADEVNAFREQTKVDQPWVAVATGADAEAVKALKRNSVRAGKAAERAAEAAAKTKAKLDDAIAKGGKSGSARLKKLETALAEQTKLADAATAKAQGLATQATEATAEYPRWFREQGKVYLEADEYLDRVLRNPKALAENPMAARKALQQQEAALESIVAREKEVKAFYLTDTTGRRAAAFDSIPRTLEANRSLQQRMVALNAKPASDRLKSITDAIDGLGSSKLTTKQKIGGALAFAAVTGAPGVLGLPEIPGAGMALPVLGAAAGSAVASRLGGAVARATAASRARQVKALDALIAGTRGARKATPPLASQILGAVRFGPEEPERKDAPKTKTLTLADSFAARSKEIAQAVQPGPDGKPVIRPHVRQRIADRFAPLAATAPHVADRAETLAVRRVEFLAEQMPRTIRLGMTSIPPNEGAIRAWARIVAAAEDPAGVLERVSDGTITPEDAMVMRELYPEMLADFTRQVVERIPELQRTLPSQSRIALSILTGAPVDPVMEPRILAQLQKPFATESGTEGGTQAPRPRPAFGSVKKPEATPAQQRAG